MTAVAAAPVTRVAPAPRPVAILDDILLELVDVAENVRTDPGDLSELMASIAELGVQSPVKVTAQADGRYRLVYGQRRVLASRELGRQRIPAIVEPPSDVDAVGARRSIEQLAENLIRKDLNPIEEAVALREVLDGDPDLSQAELGRRLGMSAPWVSKTLALLEAPETIRDLVRDQQLSVAHVSALRGLAPKTQTQLAKEAVDRGASAHELERMVQQHKRDEEWRKDRAAESKAQRDARTKGLVEKLAARKLPLDTPLRVSSWGEDVSASVEALTKAGYTSVATGGHGFQRDGCDCTALSVQVSSWSDPRIEPICTVQAHADAANAKREAKWKADHKAETDGRAAVKDRILEDLEALPAGSMLARVMLWNALSWNAKEWAKRHGAPEKKPDVWATISALPIEKVREQLADKISNSFRDIDVKVPWDAIVAEIQGPAAAPGPEPEQAKPTRTAKPKAAKAGNAPAFTPAQLAAARADLDLDGDD